MIEGLLLKVSINISLHFLQICIKSVSYSDDCNKFIFITLPPSICRPYVQPEAYHLEAINSAPMLGFFCKPIKIYFLICSYYAPINVKPAGGEAGHRAGF